ncbi:MAG: abortive infection system antitoxin AbiGi family protein [Desulfuromonadaceae bacterium]|nr:abortive infection system antitoxin AbiGi family protein [Desulfuromonadaceae bacterium]
MPTINQRYVSNELSHFVGRGLEEEDQYNLLIKIIRGGWLSHPPHIPGISGNLHIDPLAKISNNEMYSPQIVCFCDIPHADLSIHIKKYSPFGLSFNKSFIIVKGGYPVHYIPKQAKVYRPKKLSTDELVEIHKTGNRESWYPESMYEHVDMGTYFDGMIQEYHKFFGKLISKLFEQVRNADDGDAIREANDIQRFLDFQIFSFIKFFDSSISEEHEDNFYMEREWRLVGELDFTINDIETIFMPRQYSRRFHDDCPEYTSQLYFI